MKKLLIAAIALSGVSTPAFADHIAWDTTTAYDNRGQCQSALVRARNEFRAGLHDGTTPSEYNEQAKTQLACQQGVDGKWRITIL